MINFKTWLENQSKITKLAIFDYDSTLANTPEQPTGWKPSPFVAPDGKKRDGKDWWGHPESLENYDFNSIILKEFKKSRQDPTIRTVLLTGRNGMRTAHMIRDKLRQESLYGKRMISPAHQKAIGRFNSWPNGPHPEDQGHEEYYNGDMSTEEDFPKTIKGKSDGNTFTHKTYVIQKLMTENISQIDFWDDRERHFQGFIDLFKNMLETWPNLKVVYFHKVSGNKVEIIPLQK